MAFLFRFQALAQFWSLILVFSCTITHKMVWLFRSFFYLWGDLNQRKISCALHLFPRKWNHNSFTFAKIYERDTNISRWVLHKQRAKSGYILQLTLVWSYMAHTQSWLQYFNGRGTLNNKVYPEMPQNVIKLLISLSMFSVHNYKTTMSGKWEPHAEVRVFFWEAVTSKKWWLTAYLLASNCTVKYYFYFFILFGYWGFTVIVVNASSNGAPRYFIGH